MAEQVIYPQLTGLNWPSYVLQVWLTLHALGVPPENVRFLPELGHYAQPEVREEDLFEDPEIRLEHTDLRHPHPPRYHSETGDVYLERVDPARLRPRFRVNVHADQFVRVSSFPDGSDDTIEEQVGRLAHFVKPLREGMNAVPNADFSPRNSPNGTERAEDLNADQDTAPPHEGEASLESLIQQVCAGYPELMAIVEEKTRQALLTLLDELETALTQNDMEACVRLLEQASLRVNARMTQGTGQQTDFQDQAAPGRPKAKIGRDELRAALRQISTHLPPDAPAREPLSGAASSISGDGLEAFRELVENVLLSREQRQGMPAGEILRTFSDGDVHLLLRVLHRMRQGLDWDTEPNRQQIVRELLEIMTSEVFTTVAVLDQLWGIMWIHGPLSTFSPLPESKNLPPDKEAWLLSVTGGCSDHTLLMRMQQQWARNGGFLGVTCSEEAGSAQSSSLSLHPFNAGEQAELWMLLTWRRTTSDPIALIEWIVKRFIHPETAVRMEQFAQAAGGYGTLFAQPGHTAVLGGKAYFQYPCLVIQLPFAEGEGNAVTAQEKLEILFRLFLPVHLRTQIVWQEAVARLDRPTYLHHEFQRGVRLNAAPRPTSAAPKRTSLRAEKPSDPLVF